MNGNEPVPVTYPEPDPAAAFAVAVALYRGLTERKTLNLSEPFSGGDQFMRVCVKIGKDFEDWACVNVDFTELVDVWPYLLEDKFLWAYEKALGKIIYDGDLLKLNDFGPRECEHVWKQLKTTQQCPAPRFKQGDMILYDDGRPGHHKRAGVLEVNDTGMFVSFEDRADVTFIRFDDNEWMKHITKQ